MKRDTPNKNTRVIYYATRELYFLSVKKRKAKESCTYAKLKRTQLTFEAESMNTRKNITINKSKILYEVINK